MIVIDWSTRKLKQETNLQSNNKPYLNGLTYNDPTYEGQAKCFSSQSPLGLSKLSHKCMTNQFRMAPARRQMSLFVSIINPVNKNGYDAQDA